MGLYNNIDENPNSKKKIDPLQIFSWTLALSLLAFSAVEFEDHKFALFSDSTPTWWLRALCIIGSFQGTLVLYAYTSLRSRKLNSLALISVYFFIVSASIFFDIFWYYIGHIQPPFWRSTSLFHRWLLSIDGRLGYDSTVTRALLSFIYGIFFLLIRHKFSKLIKTDAKLKNIRDSSSQIKSTYIYISITAIIVLYSAIFANTNREKNNIHLNDYSQSFGGISLGNNLSDIQDSIANYSLNAGRYDTHDNIRTSKGLFVKVERQNDDHFNEITRIYYRCDSEKKAIGVTLNKLNCSSSEEEVEAIFSQGRKYCYSDRDLAFYAKGNGYVLYNYKIKSIISIGLTSYDNSYPFIEYSVPNESLRDCTGRENDYKASKRLGYSSVEQFRAHMNTEPRENRDLLNYPYSVYLRCVDDRIFGKSCFTNGSGASIIIRNGREATIYKELEISEMGELIRSGTEILFKLQENFNVIVYGGPQNPDFELEIRDRRTDTPVFRKHSEHTGKIEVQNSL